MTMTIISLQSYILISVILFSLGLFIMVTRKNAIAIIMGVELMLNAACLNFVAFNHYKYVNLDGQIFTIFVIVMAAAEAACALAIILSIYVNFKNVNADEIDNMRH